jgi:hypothetical protein
VSPEHRKPDGTRQVGPTWESLVERQIREAMEEGAFNDLPHQGTRLPIEDDSAAGAWALAHRMLKNAGAAPPWVEADKEVRARMTELDGLLTRWTRAGPTVRPQIRRQIVAVVGAINLAVERLNAEAPTDRQHRRPLDLDEVLRRADARLER